MFNRWMTLENVFMEQWVRLGYKGVIKYVFEVESYKIEFFNKGKLKFLVNMKISIIITIKFWVV